MRFEVPRSTLTWCWFLESLSTEGLEQVLHEKSLLCPSYDKSEPSLRVLRLSSGEKWKILEVKNRVQSRLTAHDSAHGIAPLMTNESQRSSYAPSSNDPNNGTTECIKGQISSQSADRQEHKVLLSRYGVARSDIAFPSTHYIINADSAGHPYEITLSGYA